MAGHTLTPYGIVATRKRARKDKDVELLLANLGKDGPVDLLDVLEKNLVLVKALHSSDESRRVSCAAVERDSNSLYFVISCDIRGEREVVHDGELDSRPAVFEKGKKHVTRYFSACVVFREPGSTSGILLLHSPWGRGGSKGQILKLMQRAMDLEPNAKAKLRADAMIPAGVLRRILNNAKATKITYRKQAGVSSEFADTSGRQSAPAEMALIVKGSDTFGFRDALTRALRASARSGGDHQLFTIQVRDGDGKTHDETFDDVEVTIDANGQTKVYSMRDDTLPTVSTNVTPEFNEVYWALPAEKYDRWPGQLLTESKSLLDRAVDDARSNA